MFTWFFFICLRANDFVESPSICTNSTRPKPPTPRVAILRRSLNLRLLKDSLSLLDWERVSFMIIGIIFFYESGIWCHCWYQLNNKNRQIVTISSSYFFLESSMAPYRSFMSFKSPMCCSKESLSMTRQVTPVLSPATMLAVRMSSLKGICDCHINSDETNL